MLARLVFCLIWLSRFPDVVCDELSGSPRPAVVPFTCVKAPLL